MRQGIFNDRRRSGDRRQRDDRSQVPPEGCRRQRERRNLSHRYDHRPWWLRIGYVEEVDVSAVFEARRAQRRRRQREADSSDDAGN